MRASFSRIDGGKTVEAPEKPRDRLPGFVHVFLAGAVLAAVVTTGLASEKIYHYRSVAVELGCAGWDRDRNWYWRGPLR